MNCLPAKLFNGNNSNYRKISRWCSAVNSVLCHEDFLHVISLVRIIDWGVFILWRSQFIQKVRRLWYPDVYMVLHQICHKIKHDSSSSPHQILKFITVLEVSLIKLAFFGDPLGNFWQEDKPTVKKKEFYQMDQEWSNYKHKIKQKESVLTAM